MEVLDRFLIPLLPGLWMTILVTAATTVVGLALSFFAGLARISRARIVRVIATIYVEIFRGTSALIQVFYLFYVLPLVGIELDPITTGVLALGLNMGAYGSEIVRGSILAVDRGQWEAAIALNMPRGLMLRRVILPQAIVTMLPAFGNLQIEYLKATSLLSLITITDLAFAGRQLLRATGDALTTYLFVLVLYFAVAFPLLIGVRLLERRSSRGLSQVRRTT
jgi:polar amino acid transport system permease protein